MFVPDGCEDDIYVVHGLDVHQAGSIFLHSRETVEVLDEMLADFHCAFSSFRLYELLRMEMHGIEDFSERRLYVSRLETPWVTERRATYHESIQILYGLSSVSSSEHFVSWVYIFGAA